MSRYRRINIDGNSLYKTETRIAKTGLLPGTFAVINNEQFEQSPALKGRLYVIESAYHQGLGVRDTVPAGDSAIGNYVEEGRELAILCPAGAYKKDTPIKLGVNGQGAIATSDTDLVIGYSQDEATIANEATDFIRVRFRVGSAASGE